MTTDAMLKLAERCEQTTGPDRLVDQAIGWLVGTQRWQGSPVTQYDGPHYTASLDAAMTLVPEGWTFTVSTYPNGRPEGLASAFLISAENEQVRHSPVYMATPALALCAAALKAKASQ